MSSAHDAIKRVVEAFERSDWSEIDVRSGDVHVHLVAGAAPSAPAAAATEVAAAPQRPTEPAESPAAIAPPVGAHVVVSPSPGIFWRAPEPGAPPFADIGDVVDESATVCIVEVMKLMNHVKAGIRGEVVAVYGTNGVAVDKGQLLFAIAPAGSAS